MTSGTRAWRSPSPRARTKAIQVRMGHSSINVTLDRYGHLFPEVDEAIAAGFGDRLAEARRGRFCRNERVVHAGSMSQPRSKLSS